MPQIKIYVRSFKSSTKKEKNALIISDRLHNIWFSPAPSPDGGTVLYHWKGKIGNINDWYKFILAIVRERIRG